MRYRIRHDESVFTLWRGVNATVNRAMVVTVGHLAAYDQFKEIFLQHGCSDSLSTHFGASFSAAFIASVLSQPLDVAKTRLMNMKGTNTYNLLLLYENLILISKLLAIFYC